MTDDKEVRERETKMKAGMSAAEQERTVESAHRTHAGKGAAMKDIATLLLTLVIMVLGLALMVGGPKAIRFLFAPVVAGLGFLARLCFVVLILVLILAFALSGRHPSQERSVVTTKEMAASESVGHVATASEKQVPDAH